ASRRADRLRRAQPPEPADRLRVPAGPAGALRPVPRRDGLHALPRPRRAAGGGLHAGLSGALRLPPSLGACAAHRLGGAPGPRDREGPWRTRDRRLPAHPRRPAVSRERLAEQRRLWERKPVLAEIYAVWFEALLAGLPERGRVLEVGAGPGF